MSRNRCAVGEHVSLWAAERDMLAHVARAIHYCAFYFAYHCSNQCTTLHLAVGLVRLHQHVYYASTCTVCVRIEQHQVCPQVIINVLRSHVFGRSHQPWLQPRGPGATLAISFQWSRPVSALFLVMTVELHLLEQDPPSRCVSCRAIEILLYPGSSRAQYFLQNFVDGDIF